MNTVNLKEIVKTYPNVLALDHASMEIKRGEIHALLGENGAGKSTLMKVLYGMARPDSGKILIEGKSVFDLKDEQLAVFRRRKIGFIFQKYHLIPQYNILQNVLMPLLIRGKSRKEAFLQAEEVIRMTGLWERRGHLPSELSGGQQQRVAIARALITKPSILLADEPTGALDSNTGKEILEMFKELNAMGNTIIQISHDINVAKAGKRIVHLKDGIMEE